ncbi:MAG TPA: hypothetical protein VFX30_14610 [bacterium]|nr:hypothetical protein [bacterium]
MENKATWKAAAFGAIFVLTASWLYAGVGELRWKGTNSWIYNDEIAGDKPGDQWDTQKTDQVANPVKWVLGKMGANPVIWLRVDDTVSTSDPAQLQQYLKTDYAARGISVNTIEIKEIGGMKVYFVSGLDKAKDARYQEAVFPRSGTKRAYHVELTAGAKDFATYEPAFRGMVQTIRILPTPTASK